MDGSDVCIAVWMYTELYTYKWLNLILFIYFTIINVKLKSINYYNEKITSFYLVDYIYITS